MRTLRAGSTGLPLLLTCILLGGSAFAQGGGALWGMGRNDSGQLGNGETQTPSRPVVAHGAGSGGVLAVADGMYFCVFLKADGSLWAMGSNIDGQLGNGTTADSSVPLAVLGAGTSGVVAVAAGIAHTLFLKDDGSLWAVGNNALGQLGDGTTQSQATPVAVAGAGGSGVVAVAAGGYHSLFLKEDGTLWAMGHNAYGQLGNGTTEDLLTPGLVTGAGASGVVALAASIFHSLFLKDDGSLWGMGYNQQGQLGDGTLTDRSVPVAMGGAGGSGVRAFAAGGYHCLLVKTDGTLWGVGYNEYGQLGDGTTVSRSQPVAVLGAGTSGVIGVTGGGYHNLFLKDDGSLWAMGDNRFGQLGDGTTSTSSLPVAVGGAGAHGVLGLAAGWSHSTFIGAAPLPEITVVASDAEAAEPADQGAFLLNRTGATDTPLTVTLSMAGTATAGSDYDAIGGTATFAAGSSTATVAVTVRDDALAEVGETVTLTIQPGAGYEVGAPATATVTISDADPGIISISPAQTALGIVLTISGRALSAKSVTARLVQAEFTTKNPKRYTLTQVKKSLTDTQVQFIAKSGKVGVYHLELFRRGVKLPYRLERAVTLRPPEIVGVTPSHAARDVPVALVGSYFGLPKGTVTLQLGKTKTRVKVSTWTDTNIVFTVPKKQKLGTYTITLQNKLGSHTATTPLIIE